jgi:hypothetical protein
VLNASMSSLAGCCVNVLPPTQLRNQQRRHRPCMACASPVFTEVHAGHAIGDRQKQDLFELDATCTVIPRVPAQNNPVVRSPFVEEKRAARNVQFAENGSPRNLEIGKDDEEPGWWEKFPRRESAGVAATSQDFFAVRTMGSPNAHSQRQAKTAPAAPNS